MAKKKFKDVTGIKFADLIMPLVMGGIGSYSPAAGRGVGLGLQAFRTFQAGQAFGDEREEKKAYQEWVKQQQANAEAELEQARLGKIDQSEVEHKGFEGKRGPATPVGGDVVEETPLGPGQISLFGGEDLGDPSLLQEGDVDLGRGGEITDVTGTGQDLLTEAILGRKRAQDSAARDLEVAEGDLRFSQALQFMEPSTGGYMAASDVMARRKTLDNLNFLNEQAGKWAESAKQKNEYSRNNILLRSQEQRDTMRVRDELEGRFTSHNTSQGVILHDKDATDPNKALIFPDQDKRGGWEELMALPIEDKIDLYNKTLGKYMASVELSQEAGEEDFDVTTVKASRDMLKMLWVSMQDPDDMAVINQVNADRSAQGLPPITSLRELDSMFGLGDMGTSGRGGNPRDKFIIE